LPSSRYPKPNPYRPMPGWPTEMATRRRTRRGSALAMRQASAAPQSWPTRLNLEPQPGRSRGAAARWFGVRKLRTSPHPGPSLWEAQALGRPCRCLAKVGGYTVVTRISHWEHATSPRGRTRARPARRAGRPRRPARCAARMRPHRAAGWTGRSRAGQARPRASPRSPALAPARPPRVWSTTPDPEGPLTRGGLDIYIKM